MAAYVYDAVRNVKRESRDFFNLFTILFIVQTKVCHLSPCWRGNIWKFVICLFVYEVTDGSYLFANRLTGLNRLAYL